ncbi:alpha/beta hydrolase [Rhodovulum steppense]|uniref:Esterase/lipase superfamily enzyme n=1 Tax=Rhodovulum steppense TaxID=540251 RepID=A0A4R1YBP8_9RHOB|nr:alpha/beta hydrolase [Rhodovulum steppense]TCM73369.1 esterase/lipase superfamily enzyme [Rhodovulum steppense]
MREPLLSIFRATCKALAPLIMTLPVGSSAQTDLADAQVPFLTVRNATGTDDPADRFGGERSDLSAGRCRVREVDLQGLSPLADAVPAFLREEFLRVDDVARSDAVSILDDLEATATAAPAIYVHGYYISFEKGCRRAVLFQENARLSGRFLWFSWPSDGSLALYTHDEADLYWSVPDLADSIIELDRRFGSGVVDVVGHSLGARGVVLALYEVANRRPDIRLDEIVLLAPDMDFAIFQRMLPRISPIAENITVYVTTGDRPLAVSAQLHGYPRLGEAGNAVETLAGVDVIDLSDLPADSPTGHLYHIYSDEVGDDLDQLLNGGLHAAERRNLVQTGSNMWSLRQFRGENDD